MKLKIVNLFVAKSDKNYLKSFLVKVILSLILILAGVSRYHFSKEIGNFSFADGGRDVLIAKHIADGSASAFITPNSSFRIIPNTPVYFWILAVGYKLGGLKGIAMLHVIASIMVVYLSFKICLLIWEDKTIALVTAFFAATSVVLIEMTAIWQTYIQLAFIASGIYFALKIFKFHKKTDYWLELIPIWFTLCLHNNGVIPAFLISLFIIWDYKKWHKIQFNSTKNWFFLIGLAGVWLSFGFLSYGLITNFFPWFFIQSEIIEPIFDISLAIKFLSFLNNFYKMSEGYTAFPFWSQLIILPVIILGLLKNFYSGPLPKKTVVFLLAIILSTLGYFLMPVKVFADWWFIAQIFVSFLLLVGLPKLFFKNNLIRKICQIILWGYLVYNSWPSFINILYATRYSYQESKIVAERVILDAKINHLKPDEFSLMINNYDSSKSLEEMRGEWGTASVQFMLETYDTAYANRLKFANTDIFEQNFQEPHAAKIHYVFCQNYPESSPSLCGQAIYADSGQTLIKTYLGEVNYHGQRPIYIYKITEI